MNGVDRYHVLMQAVRAGAPRNPAVAARADEVVHRFERKLAEHRAYVAEHGEDPEEIAAWTWDAQGAPR
jgi:xylulose-5-phosphate/fructose-6-phosphate phosphoketolase